MAPIIHYRVVFKVISRNLLIVGMALLVCLGVAVLYHESYRPFLLSAVVAFALGGLLFLFSKGNGINELVRKKDTYLTVTLSWFLIGCVGSLPYLISGAISSWTDAFFESVSGFTTTGSSILTDIEALPMSLLFWRSLTHWIGGIGIIVLVIIIMPSLKIGGYHLFTLESSLQEKIKPRIRTVGYRLLMIYLLLTFSETILLLAGHMSLFDSLCHAFGTVATGGFSPRNSSIAGYSPYVQYVVMAFMLLSGTNFIIHYFLLNGEFRKVKENEELKLYLLLILMIGFIITSILFLRLHRPLESAFREAFFQVISIITCTGYATADYLQWPAYAWILIFFSMFLGGCTGSTAGGIKIARHLLILKNIRNIYRHTFSSHAIIPLIKLNNKNVNPETNSSIMTFITVYILLFLAGSGTLALMGIDGITATGSVATCMAGIGPGIGTVGPASNFAHLPDAAKLLLAFFMIIGRLEIFTVIMLFSRAFWRR